MATARDISSSIYSYDYKTITPLKQFGDWHHLSILVVHHLRKGSSDDPMEEFSGSRRTARCRWAGHVHACSIGSATDIARR